MKMKIKKGDKVVVTSGKDKGKQGEVLRVLPREGRIVVDGVALAKRHTKKRQGQVSDDLHWAFISPCGSIKYWT